MNCMRKFSKKKKQLPNWPKKTSICELFKNPPIYKHTNTNVSLTEGKCVRVLPPDWPKKVMGTALW